MKNDNIMEEEKNWIAEPQEKDDKSKTEYRLQKTVSQSSDIIYTYTVAKKRKDLNLCGEVCLSHYFRT